MTKNTQGSSLDPVTFEVLKNAYVNKWQSKSFALVIHLSSGHAIFRRLFAIPMETR